MKLLDWMHRKLRQNNREPFKDLSSGSAYNCLLAGGNHQKLSPIVPTRIHESPMGDQYVSSSESLLLEGLLSIGTLGSSPIEEKEDQEIEEQIEFQELLLNNMEVIVEEEESEAATETYQIMVDTEHEKVLTEAAVQKGDNRLSSARSSIQVSTTGKVNMTCPLQSGFTVETTGETERKGKRATLGELFMIEEGWRRGGGAEMEKNGVNIIKKMMLNKLESRRRSSGVRGAKDAAKTAKIQKIMQIFHGKVHPENNMISKKSTKTGKNKYKYIENYIGGGDDILMTPPKGTCTNENKYGLDRTSLLGDVSDSTSSRGHWIKSDTNYLVLEL